MLFLRDCDNMVLIQAAKNIYSEAGSSMNWSQGSDLEARG